MTVTSVRSKAPPAQAPSGPGHALARRERRVALLSVLPAIALLAAFVWYPIAVAIYHSFTQWDGIASSWVGLANYRRLFTSGDIWSLVRVNLVFLCAVPVIGIVSLGVSVLLHEQTPGWRLFRSVYYLPTMLSAVIVGFLMKSLFSADGVVNQALDRVGLDGLTTNWLESVPTAFVVLILAFYWQTLGQGTLVFMAGLSAMPDEILEAARIDGAGWWRRLTRVVLPMQTPAISYFLVTNTVYVFIGLFGLVYTVTGGGPGRGTTPLDYQIYLSAFQEGDFGYSSALSVVLLVLVAGIAWFQIRNFDRVSGE